MTTPDRRQAAYQIVTGMPVFGSWATAISEYDTPFGRIGYRQLELLWALRHDMFQESPVTPSVIATHFGVQPSVVTRLLDKLETHEFIRRRLSTSDRRSSEIVITPRGMDLSRYVEELYNQEVLDVLEPFSDEEIRQLAEISRTLQEIGAALLNNRKQRITRQNEGIPGDATRLLD